MAGVTISSLPDEALALVLAALASTLGQWRYATVHARLSKVECKHAPMSSLRAARDDHYLQDTAEPTLYRDLEFLCPGLFAKFAQVYYQNTLRAQCLPKYTRSIKTRQGWDAHASASARSGFAEILAQATNLKTLGLCARESFALIALFVARQACASSLLSTPATYVPLSVISDTLHNCGSSACGRRLKGI